MFSTCPRHLLRPNSASGTINSAQRIVKGYPDPPHRNEFERTRYRQRIVSRAWATTYEAQRTAILAGKKLYFYRWSLRIFDPADFSIHKRFEFLDFIEDSFKLHLRSFFSVDGCVVSPSSQNGSVRCTFLICLNNCCIPPVDPVGERPESVGRRWATWMLSTGYPHVPKGEGRSVGLVH